MVAVRLAATPVGLLACANPHQQHVPCVASFVRFRRSCTTNRPVRPPRSFIGSFQTKEETRWLPTKNPLTRLRCGNIKGTIWQNVSEKGPFFATTFSRPFKDQSGAWRNGTSFGLNDLEALITVAHEAKE